MDESAFQASWDDVQNMDLNDLEEFLRRGISIYLEQSNKQSNHIPQMEKMVDHAGEVTDMIKELNERDEPCTENGTGAQLYKQSLNVTEVGIDANGYGIYQANEDMLPKAGETWALDCDKSYKHTEPEKPAMAHHPMWKHLYDENEPSKTSGNE